MKTDTRYTCPICEKDARNCEHKYKLLAVYIEGSDGWASSTYFRGIVDSLEKVKPLIPEDEEYDGQWHHYAAGPVIPLHLHLQAVAWKEEMIALVKSNAPQIHVWETNRLRNGYFECELRFGFTFMKHPQTPFDGVCMVKKWVCK